NATAGVTGQQRPGPVVVTRRRPEGLTALGLALGDRGVVAVSDVVHRRRRAGSVDALRATNGQRRRDREPLVDLYGAEVLADAGVPLLVRGADLGDPTDVAGRAGLRGHVHPRRSRLHEHRAALEAVTGSPNEPMLPVTRE